MKKDQNPQAPALSQKQGKNTKKDQSTTKSLVYISIDLDSGNVLIETSASVQKIEPAPFGFYVCFLSMSKAKQLKKRFEKKPYLIESFINSWPYEKR